MWHAGRVVRQTANFNLYYLRTCPRSPDVEILDREEWSRLPIRSKWLYWLHLCLQVNKPLPKLQRKESEVTRRRHQLGGESLRG